LRKDAPGGEQQREARASSLIRRDIFGDDEFALAARADPELFAGKIRPLL
jgi:hypothetical protein